MAIKQLCILPVFSSFSLLSFTPKLMASVREGKYFLKAALPVIFTITQKSTEKLVLFLFFPK